MSKTSKSLKKKGGKIANRVNKESKVLAKEAERLARKTMAEAKTKFKKAEELVKAKVKEEPERAVMIAAGVGAVVGAALAYLVTKKK